MTLGTTERAVIVEMEIDALRYSIRRTEAELVRLRAELERAEAERHPDYGGCYRSQWVATSGDEPAPARVGIGPDGSTKP